MLAKLTMHRSGVSRGRRRCSLFEEAPHVVCHAAENAEVVPEIESVADRACVGDPELLLKGFRGPRVWQRAHVSARG